MTAKLFSKTGPLAGTEFIIEKEALIGRDTHCDITLFPHTISSKHAHIFWDEEKGSYVLEDLGSSNGTFVDKTRVSTPVSLGKLNVITFANDVDMIFQVLPANRVAKRSSSALTDQKNGGRHTEYQKGFVLPTGELPTGKLPDMNMDDPGTLTSYGQAFDMLPEIPGHDDTVHPKAISETVDGGDDIIIEDVSALPAEADSPKYTLIINNVKETGRREVLKPGENAIGRSDTCEITIHDEYLSGRHALLRVDAGGVFLSDLDSRNGTFIGEDAVKEELPLERGVIFKLGPTTKILIE